MEKRSSLYTYIVEAVRRVCPKVFIAENVGGLLLKKNSDSYKKIMDDFGSLGYNVNCKLYHAEEYGVPQTRERVFIVGTQKGLPEFIPPAPTTPTNPVSVKEAIGDLENEDENKAFAHVWSKANVSGEQGNRRMLADRPGYTIRAECHGNIQFHYSLPRRISMREAARIQSFPDEFVFPCGLRDTERQIRKCCSACVSLACCEFCKKCDRRVRKYDNFRQLDMSEKMKYIRAYARKIHPDGRLWWIEGREDEHTLPIQARLYTNLTKEEKIRLRAEAALVCPEIVKSGRDRNKYDDVVLYLLTYHGVLCHQARDLFSAGSVANPKNDDNGGIYIERALKLIEGEMQKAALEMDDAIFVEYWSESVPPEQRITRWLEKADAAAKEWKPSNSLFLNR